MATAVPRLQDETYVNWCRSSLALLFLKEGLEEFTDKRVSAFHEELHTRVPQPYSRNGPIDPQQSQQQTSPCMQICKTCTSNEVQRHNYTWRVRCSSKVCSTWMKHIILHHVDNPNPTIERSNLKPQLWPSHPWEVAKCFLPYGCEHITSAKDADVAAILKLLRTCLFMSRFINDSILVVEVSDIRNRVMHSHNLSISDDQLQQDTAKMNDLLNSLVSDIRNRVMHSHNMSISDDQLQHDTTKMIDLLNSLVDLSPEETQIINNSIDSIHKLQTKLVDVTANRELVALHSRMQAVERDIFSLKDKCTDYDKTQLDLKTTSDELKVLDQNHTKIQAEIYQLKETKERFEEFLQKNDLIQNIRRLSIEIQDLHQRCGQHDQREDLQEQILEQHKQHMGHRMVQYDQRIDKQTERLVQHDQLIEQQTLRLDRQDTRIVTLEERVKSKADVPVTVSSRSWDEQCKDLQQYLQDLYRNICLWKNPITNEEEDFLQMYVNPSVKVIREKGEHGRLIKVKEQLLQSTKHSYETMFYSNVGPSENVYVTGDAGTGKTMLCNHIVLTWCKAIQNIQEGTVSAEDRGVISSFKFLFYINLRDSETTYHIEDMIKKQLMYKTSTYLDVSEILRTEKCLVVLDGLDEWSCPDGVQKCPGVHRDIPGRNITNRTCVFLTTTRNWKFDTIDLKTRDVDKHVELCGIDRDAAKEVVLKMSDYLDGKSQKGRKVDDFYTEIERKKLDNIVTVPVLLIQLVTLWHYGKDLGNSQLQLYCNMLDLLFEHSEENLPQKTTQSTTKSVSNHYELPVCFSRNEHCQNQSKIIYCLAQIAYETLFSDNREEALVFKSSKLDIFGISPSDVVLCLQCGILSQNKDYRYYTGRFKKFSFLHKKVQEFLSALHIVTFNNVDNILKELRQFCDSLDIMLEMSQVWMFVAGMRPDITRHLLTHLAEVAAADTQVQHYRQSLDGEDLIRDILKCASDCVIEGASHGHTYDIKCLEDYYFTEPNIDYVENMLLSAPSSHIKSVYINSEKMHGDKLISITRKLQQCNSLQKLHLHDPECHIPDSTVVQLVQSKCDVLACFDLFCKTVEDELIIALCNSHNLLALGMALVKPTLCKKEWIIDSVVKCTSIKELRLVLPCSPPDRQIRSSIDICSLSQLHTVGLWCVSIVNLQAVSHNVKTVRLEHVVIAVTDFCEFVLAISKSRRHVYVRLQNAKFTVSKNWHIDLKSFLKCCNGLVILKCNYESNNTWSIIFYTCSQ